MEQRLKKLFLDLTHATTTKRLWDGVMKPFCKEMNFLTVQHSVLALDAAVTNHNILFLRRYDNTQKKWTENYFSKRMYFFDRSFHLVFEHQSLAMKWSKMRELTGKSTKPHKIFLEAEKYGLYEGLLVTHSSKITQHTSFLSLGGSSDMFKSFRRHNYNTLVWCFQVYIHRMIDLAKQEALIVDVDPIDMI